MKISNLSYAELLTLRTDVDAELKRREHEEKAKARKQIVEIARTHGLSVEEIMKKSGTVRKPVETKYQHPSNQELTWTGRGRKPIWVQEWLKNGKDLRDITIV